MIIHYYLLLDHQLEIPSIAVIYKNKQINTNVQSFEVSLITSKTPLENINCHKDGNRPVFLGKLTFWRYVVMKCCPSNNNIILPIYTFACIIC